MYRIRFLVLLSVFFAFLGQAYSRPSLPDVFYRHYTGILDTTMNLIFDIFSFKGKIEGYYYYGFELPGAAGEYQYGKTIPVIGQIEGSSFTIYEKFNPNSRFVGAFQDDGGLKGKWIRQVYQKEIPFLLYADNLDGSIPLKVIHAEREDFAIKVNNINRVGPKASIELLLVYPDGKGFNGLKDKIEIEITRFMFGEDALVRPIDLLIENIIFDFFDSYNHYADGIENIVELPSFNWKKSLSMEVIYNSNNILSFRMKKHAFSGNSQGISIRENLVFDITKIKKLELSDFLIPGFETSLNAMLDRKFRMLNGIKTEENLRPHGFLIDQIEFSGNFYINNDGVGFYYNVYEIAPYSTGTTELFVSFFELRSLLKKDHPFSWVKF